MSTLPAYDTILALTAGYDPTRTTALRNAFSRELIKRFEELCKIIRKAIVDQNCFGYKPNISGYQMTLPPEGAFAYNLSAEKMEAFLTWLKQQVDRGIIQIGEYEQVGSGWYKPWTNLYILDSYKRGVIRARQELRSAGYNIPSIAESGGIDAIMGMPMHIDRVGLLFARTFNELQGITSAMDSQISRVLAQGLADGDSPRLLARKLISTINGTGMGELGITDTLGRFIPAEQRAVMLARTEIIRAHHMATIQEYRNWEAAGVFVKGEWKTAGDDRVCDKCAHLEGKIYSLDEIEGMIPAHPNCRCIALPIVVKEK